MTKRKKKTETETGTDRQRQAHIAEHMQGRAVQNIQPEGGGGCGGWQRVSEREEQKDRHVYLNFRSTLSERGRRA